MDATCKVQDNIHVFRLVHNMCPGFWVHINIASYKYGSGLGSSILILLSRMNLLFVSEHPTMR